MDKIEGTKISDRTTKTGSLRLFFIKQKMREFDGSFKVELGTQKRTGGSCSDTSRKARLPTPWSHCSVGCKDRRTNGKNGNQSHSWISKTALSGTAYCSYLSNWLWDSYQTENAKNRAPENNNNNSPRRNTSTGDDFRYFGVRNLVQKMEARDECGKFWILRTSQFVIDKSNKRASRRRKIQSPILSSTAWTRPSRQSGQCIQELVLFLTIVMGLLAFALNINAKISRKWITEVNQSWFVK